MSATFFLAAFILFLKAGRSAGRTNFVICYAFSLCAYLFALLSKEMAITLPFLILAYDLILQRGVSLNVHTTIAPHGHSELATPLSPPSQRGDIIVSAQLNDEGEVKTYGKERGFLLRNITLRLVTRYGGYLVVSAFYLFLRFSLFRNPGESAEYPGNSLYANFIMMTKVIGYYIKLLFIPSPLNADYVVPVAYSPADAAFIVTLIVVTGVIVISIKLCRLSKIWTFSILWFFITLLPVLNIVPILNIMAERYLYIPAIGFAMLWGSIFTHKISAKKRFLNVSGKILGRRSLSTTSIAVICLLFAGGTVSRNRIWLNEFTFSTETIRRSPRSFRIYNNLGYYYYHNGFTDAAIRSFRDSIQVKHEQPKAHCNLGAAYSLKGLDDKAIEELTIATRLRNDYPEAHNNLGLLYKRKGMLDRAVTEYIEALRSNPYYADAHCNLGSALIDLGRLDEAFSELEKAVKIRRNFALAHYNLAVVYYKKGQMGEAYNKLLDAYHRDPQNADVHISLGILYLNYFHDNKKALEHIREALRINPKHKQSGEMKKMIDRLISAETQQGR